MLSLDILGSDSTVSGMQDLRKIGSNRYGYFSVIQHLWKVCNYIIRMIFDADSFSDAIRHFRSNLTEFHCFGNAESKENWQ